MNADLFPVSLGRHGAAATDNGVNVRSSRQRGALRYDYVDAHWGRLPWNGIAKAVLRRRSNPIEEAL